MKPRRLSRLGILLAAFYAVAASAVSVQDLFHAQRPGDWLDLRGIGECLATLPACYVVNQVLPLIGLPEPDLYHVLESPYTIAAIVLSILSCAAIIYFATAWVQRRFFSKRSHTH